MNDPAEYYLQTRMQELKGNEPETESVEHIKNSYTYKIGSAITYIPRRVRRIFNQLLKR